METKVPREVQGQSPYIGDLGPRPLQAGAKCFFCTKFNDFFAENFRISSWSRRRYTACQKRNFLPGLKERIPAYKCVITCKAGAKQWLNYSKVVTLL